MKLPFHRYIITLLLGKVSPERILSECDKFKLPMSKGDLVSFVEELKFKHPDFFSNLEIDRLKDLEIYDLYIHLFENAKDPVFDLLFSLVEDFRVKAMVSACLLASLSMEQIDAAMSSRFDIPYDLEVIQKFAHYFFDIKSLSHTEKVGIAKLYEEKDLYLIAVEELDVNYLLWKLGLSVNKEFEQMYKELFVDFFFLFKENIKDKNMDEAKTWGDLASKLGSRVQKLEPSDKEKDRLLSQLGFETEEEDHEHFRSVTTNPK